MLNTVEIQIVYLKLLRRQPTQTELTQVSNFQNASDLSDFIKLSSEYKLLHNIPIFDTAFDTLNNRYTLSNIQQNFTKGVPLTNGYIGIETSQIYHSVFSSHITIDHKQYPIPSFTDVTIMKRNDNNYTSVHNYSQTLDMNKCFFSDDFVLYDDLSVSIQKYPLFVNSKKCFLQKIGMTSSVTTSLSVVHNFLNSKHSSNASILSLYENVTTHILNITDSLTQTRVTNMYHSSHPIVYKGLLTTQDNYQNTFDLELTANIPCVFYILTTASVKNNQNDTKVLVDLVSSFNSLEDIITKHTTNWYSHWKPAISITNKTNVVPNNILNYFNFLIVHSLFNICLQVYSTDYMYHLPVLIMLNHDLAKNALEFLIEHDAQKTDVHNKALLCIHIWNFFRASRNKNWLQITGFPVMQHNANNFFLTSASTTTNTFTKYIVSLALRFTNQAIYELGYTHRESFASVQNELLTLQFLSDDNLVQVTDSNLSVRLGSNNGLYHFDFYDSQDNYIGYNFGGSSGYKLSLLENTDYTIKVNELTKDFPIQFTDTQNITTILNYHFDDNNENMVFSSLNNTQTFSTVYTQNSSNLQSYALYTNTNMYSTFKEMFNHTVGKNAFIQQSINSVISPYENYNFENIEFVEPYLMLNSYYNQGISDFDDKVYLSKIIKDNITYFASVSSNNPPNKIMEAGLFAMVSQYETEYKAKRSYMNMFYNQTLSILNFNEPWCQKDNTATMLLFVLLTCIFELTPHGITNQNRYMLEEYGIHFPKKNVLPDVWKNVQLSSIGIDNSTFTMTNGLYIDTPFTTLLDGIRFTPILNELEHTLTIETNLLDIYNHDTAFEFALLLQDVGDDNTYTIEQIKTHPLAITNTPRIVIPLSVLDGVQNEPFKDPVLYDRIINVYTLYNNVERVVTQKLNILTDTTSTNLINPTIHALIDYTTSSNQMNIHMSFNSFDRTLYDSFSNLNITIEYNPHIITSNITFESDNNNFVLIQPNTSNITIQIVNENATLVSGDYVVGTLIMELNSETNLHRTNYMPVPFSGTVRSFKEKNIHIVNPESFPPTSYETIPFSEGYINKRYSLNNDMTNFQSIQELVVYSEDSSYSYTLPFNEFCDARDCLNHTFFTLSNNALEYYAVGDNTNNILLTSQSNHDTLDQITRCEYLESFLSENNFVNYRLFTSTKFNMLLTDTNLLYGMGYNESYNLGTDGENTNSIIFEECTNINTLTNSLSQTGVHLSHLLLHDTSTIVCYNSNIVYGVGENTVLFSPTLLKTITPLMSINSFFDSNTHYLIQDIKPGVNHLKFMLFNTTTQSQEWWGIGKNVFSSMGIHPSFDPDFVVKDMKRLHLIEKLIHGTRYDANYKGPWLNSSSKYTFIHPHSSLVPFTAILDTITYDVYIIGSLDNGVTIHNEWKKMNTIIDAPLFVTTFSNNQIMVGY